MLAAVLTDRKAGTCAVSFGSDPVFEAALSRCLTEAVQGTDHVSRPITAGPAAEGPTDICNNPHVLLSRLTGNSGNQEAMKAFVPPDSNRRLLELLIDRVRRLGRQLYVRDASLLGFPSYFVYADGLSQVSEIREGRFAFRWRRQEEVRRTILNIDACSRQEVAEVADLLFQELTRADPLLEVDFEQNALDAPVIYWMGFRPVVASMLIESGEYAKALTVLNWPRSTLENDPDVPDCGAVRRFCELLEAQCRCRPESWPEARVPEKPQEDPSADPSFHRLSAEQRRGASGLAETSRRRFQQLPIPRCLSVYACPSCSCRKYCFVDDWYRLARTLRSAVSPADPQDLLRMLATTAFE